MNLKNKKALRVDRRAFFKQRSKRLFNHKPPVIKGIKKIFKCQIY